MSSGEEYTVLWFASVFAVVLGLMNLVLFFTFLSRSAMRSFARKLAAFEGELADLTERFTRFQRKEGMRAARAAKEPADLNEELVRMAGGGNSGPSGVVPGPGSSTFPIRK